MTPKPFMYPELSIGSVDISADDVRCERCGKQPVVYVLDPSQDQHFACLDCCGQIAVSLISANPQPIIGGGPETVATYRDGDREFQIDHLGIGHPEQWGSFAVYEDGGQLAEFAVTASWFVPEARPPLPSTTVLIELAKATVHVTESEEDSEHVGLPALDLSRPDEETRQRWNACAHEKGAYIVAHIGDAGADDPDQRGLPWQVSRHRPDALPELDGIRVTLALGVCGECSAPVIGVSMADYLRWTPEHGPAWRLGYVRPRRDGEPPVVALPVPTPQEALTGPSEAEGITRPDGAVDLDHRTFVDTMRRLDPLVVRAASNLDAHGLATGFRLTSAEFEEAIAEATAPMPIGKVLALACTRLAEMTPRP